LFDESLEEDDESTLLVGALFGIYRDINFINVNIYYMKFSIDIVAKVRCYNSFFNSVIFFNCLYCLYSLSVCVKPTIVLFKEISLMNGNLYLIK